MANFSGASLDFFVGFSCFFGGTLDEWLVDLDVYFCFFGGGGGGEAGDVGEVGVDGCPGDNGEGECSSAGRGNGGGGGDEPGGVAEMPALTPDQ